MTFARRSRATQSTYISSVSTQSWKAACRTLIMLG